MTGTTKQTVFKGDISPETKTFLESARQTVIPKGSFAEAAAGGRLVLTEVELYRREKDGKTHIKVTYEVTVTPDMLNHTKTLHGGCSVYLIDVCSSVALAALGRETGKPTDAVSQALISTFHAPAPVGSTIQIVNTTVSYGSRVLSAVTEIWDVTNKRLCVTGVHNKMAPSPAKL